eukprot:495217-Alexandrium_andersonii.AAC.1
MSSQRGAPGGATSRGPRTDSESARSWKSQLAGSGIEARETERSPWPEPSSPERVPGALCRHSADE